MRGFANPATFEHAHQLLGNSKPWGWIYPLLFSSPIYSLTHDTWKRKKKSTPPKSYLLHAVWKKRQPHFFLPHPCPAQNTSLFFLKVSRFPIREICSKCPSYNILGSDKQPVLRKKYYSYINFTYL